MLNMIIHKQKKRSVSNLSMERRSRIRFGRYATSNNCSVRDFAPIQIQFSEANDKRRKSNTYISLSFVGIIMV